MGLQTGTGLIIAYKKEVTFGALPTNDSSAKQLRRTRFGLGLTKDAIKSTELRRDFQRPASRHAMRRAGGDIEGELSLGTYAAFIGSGLRRDFAAVTSLAALINVTATVGAPQFVRATGSWITDGLRVGMTVRMAGWTTTGVANNAKNFTIIALTATQMTVAEAVAAKAAGDSVVVSIPGKCTYIPLTGHTNDSYAFEQWAPDAAQSRRFLGQRVGGLKFSSPANDKAMFTATLVGQDRTTAATQYFTSASAAGTAQMQTGLLGSIYINGVAVGVLTSWDLTTTNGLDTVPVSGSPLTPDVFQGPIDVSGSFSVLWQDATMDGYFDNETEVPILLQLRDSTAAACDFLNLVLPANKISGGDAPDAEKAIVQSFSFTARVGDGSNGYEATTLFVQDSLA